MNRFNVFFPSSTLTNIRLNVILLYAFALILGGLYVDYTAMEESEFAVNGRFLTGIVTVCFGLLNIFATRIRSKVLISSSLVIWFTLLIYQSFKVLDPTQAAIGINMALLSLIILVTIYYSSKAGLSILLLITSFNFYRLYAVKNGIIAPQIADNSGIFETNLLAILSLYSCTIAGYYQYQSQLFLNKLKKKKESLTKAITELKAKEKALITIFGEIKDLSDEKLPLIKPTIYNCLQKIESGNEEDFNQILLNGSSTMKNIDEVLRSIDQQVQAYEID